MSDIFLILTHEQQYDWLKEVVKAVNYLDQSSNQEVTAGTWNLKVSIIKIKMIGNIEVTTVH